VFRRLI